MCLLLINNKKKTNVSKIHHMFKPLLLKIYFLIKPFKLIAVNDWVVTVANVLLFELQVK